MALDWIARRDKDKSRVFIADASALIFARFKASFAGFDGEFLH